jgi:hypothetical protein
MNLFTMQIPSLLLIPLFLLPLSNTPNLCSSLMGQTKHHTHVKKAGNITVLSTLISTFLDNRQEVRVPLTACQQVFS